MTACFGARARGRPRVGGDLAGQPLLVLAGVAAFGVTELALAPQSSLAAAAPLLVAAGLAFTLWTSNTNATLQLSTPDRLRGRMMGFYYFAFNGAAPRGRPAGRVAGVIRRDRACLRHERDGRAPRRRRSVRPLLSRAPRAAPSCCASRYGERVIDLRTDTITQPTAGMRRRSRRPSSATAKARGPTVDALEERGAVLLGHEEAVFLPTATMANQIALRILTDPGARSSSEADAHLFLRLGGPRCTPAS